MSRREEREHRYLVDREAAETLLATIADRAHLEVYDPHRPVAYSRTTYLDSRDSDYFRSCGEAVVRRARLREYAAAASPLAPVALTGACFLEYKENAGAARSKVRLAIPRQVVAALARGDEIEASWRRRLAAHPPLDDIARRLRTGELTPCLTTWYRRVSLVRDSVRITLDEGVALCSPIAIDAPATPAEPHEVAGYVPGRIVEVKMRGPAPGWLRRALDPLPAATRFSKFQAGMLAVQRSRRKPLQRTQPLPVFAPMRVRSADDQA